jgi:hypothetical protein
MSRKRYRRLLCFFIIFHLFVFNELQEWRIWLQFPQTSGKMPSAFVHELSIPIKTPAQSTALLM